MFLSSKGHKKKMNMLILMEGMPEANHVWPCPSYHGIHPDM